jgi:hypothetical protein
MAGVGGVPPTGGPKEPQWVRGPEDEVKAGKDDQRIPNNWAEAIKKYPQLLQSTVKMMAMKLMKEMRKSVAKMKKNE